MEVRPEAEARTLERAAIDVMDEKFVTVLPRENLKQALLHANSKDADTIVVQDDQKNILGIIDRTKYLGILENILREQK